MKKKKSANNGAPYSLCLKFAPSTTSLPSLFNLSSEALRDKTVFSPFSVSVCIRIKASGVAANPAFTSSIENVVLLPSLSYHIPFLLKCCSLSEVCGIAKSARPRRLPSVSTN